MILETGGYGDAIVVDPSVRTWTESRLETMSDAERKRYVEQVIAAELQGRPHQRPLVGAVTVPRS